MPRTDRLRWIPCTFKELDVPTFHAIMRLRIDVFVVEQHCPYPELDGLDEQAIHLCGTDEAGALVAYCRILPPQEDGLPHIGRVVVHPDSRHRGIGRRLMEEAIRIARLQSYTDRSALAAQAHLQAFYESLGYVPVGEAYLLDGIPHINMVRHAGTRT